MPKMSLVQFLMQNIEILRVYMISITNTRKYMKVEKRVKKHDDLLRGMKSDILAERDSRMISCYI